jgi:hypothetical protein
LLKQVISPLVFTVIAIGFFGGEISTTFNVNDVLTEKYKGGNSLILILFR